MRIRAARSAAALRRKKATGPDSAITFPTGVVSPAWRSLRRVPDSVMRVPPQEPDCSLWTLQLSMRLPRDACLPAQISALAPACRKGQKDYRGVNTSTNCRGVVRVMKGFSRGERRALTLAYRGVNTTQNCLGVVHVACLDPGPERSIEQCPPIERVAAHSLGPEPLRASARSAASVPRPSPHWVARRSRNHDARAGLNPPVDTDTVTPPSRCTAGRMKDEWARSSALFTQTPDSVGVGEDCSVDVGNARGGHHQPEAGRVPGPVGPALHRLQRGDKVLHLVAERGATTVTSAPQESRPPAFRAATRPPPTTNTAPTDVQRDREELCGRPPGLSHGAGEARPCPLRSSRTCARR